MEEVINLLEIGRDAFAATVMGTSTFCLTSFAASYAYEKSLHNSRYFSDEELENRLQETKEASREHRDESFTAYKDAFYMGREKALKTQVKDPKQEYHNQLYWEE